ncbi:MAG TPA: hypothetical protein VL970_11605, partial [Candidatus Acidoferrales bacterium]|nr:hypothetical protein [Candidatus Acidoferrales bacterium]
MNRFYAMVFLGLLFQLSLRADNLDFFQDNGPLGFVNILQGTDSHFELSHGNTLPLVGAPWGMIDWSIENEKGDWFFQPNGKIDGFRATHQPSPWISDYGQFVLMPQSGALQMDAAARTTGYDTNTSILRPDYEKLDLPASGITAELTASERCGVFRFAFRQGAMGRLILNACGASEINIDGRTIRGLSRANSGGVAGDFASYFVIKLDRDLEKVATFVNRAATNSSSGKGENTAAYVEFKTSPAELVEV